MIFSSKHAPAKLSLVGGKALGLLRLSKLKDFESEEFLIVSTLAFFHWKKMGTIPNSVSLRLKELGSKDQLWAVRSSAVNEDSSHSSMAGVFKTLLNVKSTQLESALVEIFQSAKSQEANSTAQSTPAMAVVIQRMIPATLAGICFSRNPTGNSTTIRMEWCAGLGLGAVDGSAPLNSSIFSRDQTRLLEESKQFSDPELSLSQQREVANRTLRLEKIWGCPVDIEWALYENKIYVLQVRPITQNFPKLAHLTDENLVESYPGLTQPLSCDLAKRMYAKVFQDCAAYLGASEHLKEKLKSAHENMIQEVSSHLYYSLENYQKALSPLPMGRHLFIQWKKLVDFHTSTNSTIEESTISTGFFQKCKFFYRLLRLKIFHSSEMNSFFRKADQHLAELESELLQLRGQDALAIFDRISQAWNNPPDLSLAVLNDFFLLGRQSLLSTGAQLESLAPPIHLKSIEKKFTSKGLRPLFASVPKHTSKTEDLLEHFRGSGHSSLVEELEEFLRLYGDRCLCDLKLESRPPRIDAQVFLQLLCASLDSQEIAPRDTHNSPDAIAFRENCRLIRSRYYGWFRRAFLLWAESLPLSGEIGDVFWLRFSDLEKWREGKLNIFDLSGKIESAKEVQRKRATLDFPPLICVEEGQWEIPTASIEKDNASLGGVLVSGSGMEGVVRKTDDPSQLSPLEDLSGTILVTKTTDPAWVYCLGRIGGMISERGGALSHLAIMAREMKTPMLVQAKESWASLKDGDRIKIQLDGKIQIFPKD